MRVKLSVMDDAVIAWGVALVVFIVAGFAWMQKHNADVRTAKAQTALDAQSKTTQDLRENLGSAREEARSLQEKIKALENAMARLETQKEEQDKRLAEHKTEWESSEARYKAELAASEKRYEVALKTAQEQAALQFEKLANDIFEKKTTTFKQDSKQGLETLLKPLQKDLETFHKKVDDSFGTHRTEQVSLKKEIERIVLANEKLTLQTDNLTTALKGDSKTQGNWGEIMLEKILEESGLRKDKDYTLQGSGLQLKDEDGKHKKPDVIVNLPDGKHIIVDSKVSLTDYEQYCSAQDDETQKISVQKFLSSIKRHVGSLADTKYQNIDKLNTLDYVLMFMPIEGAYALAVQSDPEIFSYAWKKRIILVCPSTLFAILRSVAHIWRIERQNQNTQEIARLGGRLYDKIVSFAKDMESIGVRIVATQEIYQKAFDKLSKGKKDTALRIAERLKDLGVATNRSSHSLAIVEDMNTDEAIDTDEAA